MLFKKLLRPINLFVIGSYVLLSVVPFVPLLLGKTVTGAAQILVIEVTAWTVLWALFKRPAWFHWLLLPAFLILPADIYLLTEFSQTLSSHHLGIISESSPKETAEFLGNNILLFIGIVLGILIWWGLVWRASFKTQDLDWKDNFSRWLFLFVLVVTLGVLHGSKKIIVNSTSSESSSSAESSKEEEDDSSEKSGIFQKEQYLSSRPFGIAVIGYEFWRERRFLATLAQQNSQFKFGAYQNTQNKTPQLIVLVIGESSRYDRWNLNGYARETNPLLSKETNLITFSDALSPVSATRLAVPLILSRKPTKLSLEEGFKEKTLISAFKEAGFKTYWLSNQLSFSYFDTPVSALANEADIVQFMNLGGYTNDATLDQVLFEPFKTALADPAPHKLIVLHTLGNHWNYSYRYPPEFDHWKPSLLGNSNPTYDDQSRKDEVNNSYDNSVLYADWVLSQIIGIVKSHQQLSSALVYVSDHGENLVNENCKLGLHGSNTEFDFHIPLFTWYSDTYANQNPNIIEQLLNNRNARLNLENIFHTVVDMGNIKYPDEQLDRSFVSKSFQPHRRYVDSYGWTDYDNATPQGDCHEIISKGDS
jgi:glucan phosphoethanolaminetransferase (alkaline phosphatase superfamily)